MVSARSALRMMSLVCFSHQVGSREMLNHSSPHSTLYINVVCLSCLYHPLVCGGQMNGVLASLPCDCGVRLQKYRK